MVKQSPAQLVLFLHRNKYENGRAFRLFQMGMPFLLSLMQDSIQLKKFRIFKYLQLLVKMENVINKWEIVSDYCQQGEKDH